MQESLDHFKVDYNTTDNNAYYWFLQGQDIIQGCQPRITLYKPTYFYDR